MFTEKMQETFCNEGWKLYKESEFGPEIELPTEVDMLKIILPLLDLIRAECVAVPTSTDYVRNRRVDL